MRCVGLKMTLLGFVVVNLGGADRRLCAEDRTPPKESPLKAIEALVPADFCAAVVLHPRRMTTSPALKPLPVADIVSLVLQSVRIDADKYRWAFDPAKLQRVVMLVDPFPGGNVAFFPAVVLEFSEDVDGRKLLAASWKDVEECKLGEKVYYKSETATLAKAPMAAYLQGKRVVMLAPEVTLRKMLEAAKEPSALRKRLATMKGDYDLLVDFVSKPALEAMSKLTGQTVEQLVQEAKKSDQPIEMILGGVESAQIAVAFRGKSLLQATVVATSGESADDLHGLINKARKGASDMFADQKDDLPDQLGAELAKSLTSVAEQLLEGVSVKKEKSRIRIKIEMPKGVAELSKRLGEAFAAQPDPKKD